MMKIGSGTMLLVSNIQKISSMISISAIRPSHARINDASKVGLFCQQASK